MKRIISSVLAAVMMLTLMAGIVCLPVSAFNAEDYGECTLWSDKTVYEVGDPIWVKGSVENNTTDPSKPAWIGLIVRDHSEWGGLRYVYPRDAKNGEAQDLAAGGKGGNHNLAPYQSLPVGEYTIVLIPDDLPLAGDPARKKHILKFIDIEIVEKKMEPAKAPTDVTYNITNPTSGMADGKVTVTLPADHNAAGVQAFWGTADGKLEDYTGLAVHKVSKTATEVKFNMVKNTFIPPNATHLLVYSVNGVGELSEDYVSVELPAGCGYQFPEGKPLLEFQAVSDIHISTAIREAHYRAMLKDIAENSPDSVGIFVAGDNVDSGPNDSWWKKLWELYDKVDGLPHMYLAIGNHEFSGYQSYEPALNQFLKYLRVTDDMEKPEDVPYYDTWINDYHFIVLGNTVYEPGVRATIGQEQYEWLEEKLGEAEDDRPIFLFMHQGMKNTVSGTAESERWWGINDDAKLRQLLKEYPNVFFFTGHTHSDMNSANSMYGGGKNAVMFNTGSVGDLWTPSTDTSFEGSQGLYVQVYGDKVLVRGRDFVTGQWVASAQFVVNDRYSVKPDTSALEAEIKAVEALTANDYTAETWVALSQALTAAKDAMDFKVQADIDAALATLKSAREALVAVPGASNDSGCGSALSLGAIALIGTLTMATVVCTKKRKED
jgi:hypothetical protein